MRNIYLVIVRRSDERYIDSFWLAEERATARRLVVIGAFNRAGLSPNQWSTWVSEGEIEDAEGIEIMP